MCDRNTMVVAFAQKNQFTRDHPISNGNKISMILDIEKVVQRVM